jgi:hypothetical protein
MTERGRSPSSMAADELALIFWEGRVQGGLRAIVPFMHQDLGGCCCNMDEPQCCRGFGGALPDVLVS